MERTKLKKILLKCFGLNTVSWVHGAKFFYLNLIKKPKLEPELIYLKKYQLANTIAIDAGANSGDWSFILSNYVGRDGLVLSFEPHPYYFLATKRAIQLSFRKNILLKNIALTSKKSKVNFAISQNNKDLDYLSKVLDDSNISNNFKTIQISGDTIDNLSKKIKLPVSLLKIDVEGHEFDVIKGSVNTIKKYFPIIVFEVNNNINGIQNFNYIKEFLSEFGYKLYHLDKNLKPIEYYNYEDLPPTDCHDILALTTSNKNNLAN